MSCFFIFRFQWTNKWFRRAPGPFHQIVAPEEINIQCHTNHYHFRKILPGSQAFLGDISNGLETVWTNWSNMSCLKNSVRNYGFHEFKRGQKGKGSEVWRGTKKRTKAHLHSNTVSFGSLDQQHNAFKMFIGEPAQFPMMRDKGIHLQPGREHFVDLSATVVSTRGIRDISPEARGCFFKDEGELEFYKSYTFSNCRLEFMIKEAEKRHKCIPWYLPKVTH